MRNLTPLPPLRGRGGALIALALLLLLAAPALAQTDTPTPGPTATGSGAAATLGALPTFELLGGSPTHTPPPTVSWPTLTPDPRLTPVPWAGIGDAPVTPGGAYQAPPFPDLDGADPPGLESPNGFQALNDANLGGFMVYLVDVAISFFGWFTVNFPRVIVAARWFVIIMMILYGIYYLWKGSRFAPPDADRDENPRRFFFRSFRLGGRYYYYTRGRRKAASDPNAPRQERLL